MTIVLDRLPDALAHRRRVIGANVRAARLAAGMTQVQLAAALGTSHPAVSRWENGGDEPTDRTLDALAAVLRCSVDELLTERA